MAQQASSQSPAAAAPASVAVPAPVPPTGAATPAPGPAPVPRAASVQAPVNASSYRINPGDDLEVYVWGEERLQREVKVLPDGTFEILISR